MLGPTLGRELLGFLDVDPALVFHVGLVAGDHDDNILVISVVAQFANPLLDLVEGLGRYYLVDDDGAVCVAIVYGCDCIVLLLAGGVPDGQLDLLVVVPELDIFFQVACIDGGFLIVIELVFGEFESHGGLPDSTCV